MKNKFYLIIAISVFMLSACAGGMPMPMVIDNSNYEQPTLPQVDPDTPAPNYFRVSMLEKKAAQPVETSAPVLKTPIKESITATKKPILKRLSKIESRLNYVVKYSRENRNRIGLLEERFNLSTSGKIQAEIILFKPDSSKLSVDGEKFLKNLAIEYTGGKVENIVIKGHASVTKGKIDNKILAKKRAESTYSYLKARCVPAKIIPVGETDEYGINTNAMITWLGKR